MRILAVPPVPEWSVADVHRGWMKGLRHLGVHVREVPFPTYIEFYTAALCDHPTEGIRNFLTVEQAIRLASERIKVHCYDWQPDVLLVTTGNHVNSSIYDAIRRRGTAVVVIATESPYEDDSQVRLAEQVDAVILNDPTNLERFRTVNPRTWWIGHAYDPDLHTVGPPEPEDVSDFAFVGTGFPNRIEFFESVDWTGIDVALGGNWQATREDSPLRRFLVHPIDHCLDNVDAVKLYRGTKVSANIYRRAAERPELSEGWAMGPREVEVAAMGVPFLREPRGENEMVLPMLPAFEGPGDFGEKLRWLLAHDAERDEMAAKAQAAVADRTFEANASEFLRLLAA